VLRLSLRVIGRARYLATIAGGAVAEVDVHATRASPVAFLALDGAPIYPPLRDPSASWRDPSR
jgi:hypothetical protein